MENSNTKIKRIIMMTRHGQRSPLITSKDETYWKTPAASLTSKGASTMYLKGKFLYEHFKYFFENNKIDNTTMRIYSSNLNRTVMTAYYFVKGLFNIKTPCDLVANESEALAYLNQFQFIRKPIKYDIVLRYYNAGASKTFADNIQTANLNYKNKRLKFDLIEKFLPYMPSESRMTLDNLSYLTLFYFIDMLKIYLSHDLEMPYGISMELYRNMNFMIDLFDEIIYGASANIKLGNYGLTCELEKILSDDKNLFTLFSAHDLNISAFLRLFKFHVPEFPFGAHWVLTFYDDNHVELHYFGDAIRKVHEFPSEQALLNYLREATYKSDADFLKELRCEISDNILKEYQESSTVDIEKERII